MALTARAVYSALIRLHPRGFRDAFSGDMLCIFDDAEETYGARWLVRDAVVSLMRQRVLRSEKVVAAGTVQGEFCLLSGIYPDIRAPHITPAKLAGALLLTLLSLFLYPLPELAQHHSERSVKAVRMGVHYR